MINFLHNFDIALGLIFVAVMIFVIGTLCFYESDVPKDLREIFYCDKNERALTINSIKDVKPSRLINLEKCNALKIIILILCSKHIAKLWIKRKYAKRHSIDNLIQSIAIKIRLNPKVNLIVFENATIKYYKVVKNIYSSEEIKLNIIAHITKNLLREGLEDYPTLWV